MAMTKEEKQLLIQELCARLPYGIYIYHEDYCEDNPEKLDTIYCDAQLGDYGFQCCVDDTDEGYHNIEKIKPYLRPMSSMTEDERNEYLSVKMQETERVALAELYRPEAIFEIMGWLLAHHFDYRGLIGMGLALPAPEGMYNEVDTKDVNWRYYPKDRFSSYDEYARYLKCEGLAADAPEGKCNN